MSASTSGADNGGVGGSGARNRTGQPSSPSGTGETSDNSTRTYSSEQLAEVVRILKCSPMAFYDILDLKEARTSVTDVQIKRAYRRLSLLTHPDKNGHENADEVFKMVSRAFSVLGDKDKRDKFDRYGTDPDSRFASAQAQNPFAGAGRGPFGPGAGFGGGGFPGGFGARFPGGGAGAGGGGPWEEVTPEEMFRRFFGGFGGGFDAGPQFVFNMGGGPGVRVHQFGGGRPRARPRDATANNDGQPTLSTLISLLPIFLFFILPIITSLLSGIKSPFSGPPAPTMVFDRPSPPYTIGRRTEKLRSPYFVNPDDVRAYSDSQFSTLDRTAEHILLGSLRRDCASETAEQERLRDDARSLFFGVDQVKMARADAHPKPSCRRLAGFGVSR